MFNPVNLMKLVIFPLDVGFRGLRIILLKGNHNCASTAKNKKSKPVPSSYKLWNCHDQDSESGQPPVKIGHLQPVSWCNSSNLWFVIVALLKLSFSILKWCPTRATSPAGLPGNLPKTERLLKAEDICSFILNCNMKYANNYCTKIWRKYLEICCQRIRFVASLSCCHS